MSYFSDLLCAAGGHRPSVNKAGGLRINGSFVYKKVCRCGARVPSEPSRTFDVRLFRHQFRTELRRQMSS